MGLIVPPPNAKRMKTLVFFLLLSACALSPSHGVPATLVLLHDAVNTVGKIIVQRNLATWRAKKERIDDARLNAKTSCAKVLCKVQDSVTVLVA